MKPRRLLPALSLVLPAMLLGLAGCGFGGSDVAPPGRAVGTRLDGKIPAAILQLPLVDAHGRTRHLADFKDKVVVISDSMTLCQESCPLDTASIVHTAKAVHRAGLGDRVVFLSITVDPQRDTPAQLAAYRKLYDGPDDWLTLTGTPAHLQRLWKYLGVFIHRVKTDEQPPPRNWRTGKPLTYDVQHSDEVFFLDGRGHERFVLEGMPDLANRKEIPPKLYRFLTNAGRQNVAHPAMTAWTEPQALQVIGWLLDRKISA